MDKVYVYSVLVLSLVLVLMPLSSAGLFDWFKQFTGQATSGSTSINVSVGNAAPNIYFVESIVAVDPTEDSTVAVTFTLYANDSDGVANLNDTSVQVTFNRTGETSRTNSSCVLVGDLDSYSANYTCTVDMYYFDGPGSWDVNVTIDDINGASGENSSSSFTYNVLTAIQMVPTALTWPALSIGGSNTGSNNDPILINNTGNDDIATDFINVTAYDLEGETTGGEFIYAGNFSVDVASEGCSGVVMSNATSLNVTGALLTHGNHSVNYGNETSGQEQLYFCINAINPDLSSQAYSTPSGQSWVVQITT